MPVLLILLIAAVVELTVLVSVADAIGVLATIGLLIAVSVIGLALLRHAGMRTLMAFHEALRTRRPPHREMVDGMLIAAAGVGILLPGFVSDALGLLLLLPPTRALVRRRMLRAAQHRSTAPFGTRSTPGPVIDGEVIDGEVIEGEVVDEAPASAPGPERR